MMQSERFPYLTQHLCLEAYLDKHGLKGQLGILKPAELEGVNDYRGVNTAAALDIKKSSLQIEEECNLCGEAVNKREIRKKAVYMNMLHEVYCLGGYLFNPIAKERTIPDHDWKFDLRTKTLTPIAPIPDGRVHYGCAAHTGSIYVIGGQSYENVPFNSVLKYDTYSNEWTRLPNLPNALSWSGVAVDEQNRVIVIGGYSVLVGEPHISGECYMYTPGQNTWKAMPNLLVGACNVMAILSDKYIYAMGGRTIDKKGKTESVPNVYRCTKDSTEWEFVTEIPDYDIRTKGLLFEGGVLSMIDRIVDKKTGRIIDSKTVKHYKVDDNTWYDGEYTQTKTSRDDIDKDDQSAKQTSQQQPKDYERKQRQQETKQAKDDGSKRDKKSKNKKKKKAN